MDEDSIIQSRISLRFARRDWEGTLIPRSDRKIKRIWWDFVFHNAFLIQRRNAFSFLVAIASSCVARESRDFASIDVRRLKTEGGNSVNLSGSSDSYDTGLWMETVVSTFCDCLKMFDCIRCISFAIRDAIAQLEKLILAMEKGKIELNCGLWLKN